MAFGMLHAVVSYGSGLRIVVRIHRYCGQGGEMEQETTESHKVKGIAGAYSPFVEADVRSSVVVFDPSKLAPIIQLPALRFCM